MNLAYRTSTDSEGRTLYCFTTPDGTESPTLHVRPGDQMVVNVKNQLPKPAPASAMRMTTNAASVCGAATMDASSVNLHWHGTNISPACHSDEVIHTLINSGDTFTYNITFPNDEPPGLYWYHPHVHGIAEAAVLGGASGALIVDGIENIQPSVARLPERVLIVRDQVVGNPDSSPDVPAWDLTLNYIPISYPVLTPAVISTKYGEEQFWRVLNASADTILDVQLLYDGVPQTLMLVALDGVPVGSQDGTRSGNLVPVTDMRIPPASRAEFIIVGPSKQVKSAQFLTERIDTGPDGDNDTRRVLATIVGGPADAGTGSISPVSGPPWQPRFSGLASEKVTTTRHLYFSENDDQTEFYITVDGQMPVPFSVDRPPAIVTTQGSVEDWIIENRALENHEFHFHQIHFLVLSQDNFETNGSHAIQAIDSQMMDMIETPYWDGNPAHPYPSVTLRMDFRGADIGDFVYHCHILNHEDQGMMAIIRVLPAPPPKSPGGRP